MAPQASNDVTPSPKQIVFLFMAATVVAVVVFLCGVLVGRGVPLGPMSVVFGGAGGDGPFGDTRRPAVVDSLNAEPSAAALSGDDLTYYRRLGSDGPLDERLVDTEPGSAAQPPRPIAEAPEPVESAALDPGPPASSPVDSADAAVRSGSELPEPVTEPPPPAPVAAPARSRSGFTVQVAALRRRGAAEEIANRLSAKGFPAFVVDPAPDAPVAVFRVRVGRYPDRRDAERVLHRLESEEQYKPWITR